MTHTYGFQTRRGEWTGTADTIAQAITACEAETGSYVIRGRCLDNYTTPGPSEVVDTAGFIAAMRALSNAAREGGPYGD